MSVYPVTPIFGFLHEGHFFVPPPYRGVTTMLRRKSLPGGEQGRWASDRLIRSLMPAMISVGICDALMGSRPSKIGNRKPLASVFPVVMVIPLIRWLLWCFSKNFVTGCGFKIDL